MNTNQHNEPSRSSQVYEEPPKLWNPNAAANWSVLLSPLFGIFLHRQNWKAMGEHKEANKSLVWLLVGITLLILGFFADVPAVVWVIFLIAWYFIHAKKQSRHVEEDYGDDYEHRHWLPAIGTAIGTIVVFFAIAFGIAFLTPKSLPKVDDPVVMQMLDQIIKESDAYKHDPTLAISSPTEVAYDKAEQQRHGKVYLQSKQGKEDLYYRVQWQDKAKGLFQVAVETPRT